MDNTEVAIHCLALTTFLLNGDFAGACHIIKLLKDADKWNENIIGLVNAGVAEVSRGRFEKGIACFNLQIDGEINAERTIETLRKLEKATRSSETPFSCFDEFSEEEKRKNIKFNLPERFLQNDKASDK
jgi:hypothetical protein